MTIEFREHGTLSHSWQLEVWSSGVLIGHVRRHPSWGIYRYYAGADNDLNASFEDEDLERLKEKVRTGRGGR